MDTPTSEHAEHVTAGQHGGPVCRCSHHKAIPIIAILIGLEFFLAEINVFTWGFVNVTWPLLLVIAGIVGLFGRSCHCHHG